MTRTVFSCDEDEYLEDVADKMRIHNVSRLLVRDAQGHMVGVLSFGHILRKNKNADEIANIVEHATRKSAAQLSNGPTAYLELCDNVRWSAAYSKTTALSGAASLNLAPALARFTELGL